MNMPNVNKEPLIKTDEESKKTPPVAHEGGSPLKAEKPEGEQASVPAADTERIVPPTEEVGESKTEGAGKPKPEVKAENQHVKMLISSLIRMMRFLNTPVFGEKTQ